jgi:hypothetical protein
MPRRNRQLVIVAATIVATIAAVLVAANIEAVDHKCAWQFPSIASCLLSARETLAAGLIGTGGAIFAGWLAYSAAQESAALALKEALAAKRAALSEQATNYATEIDRLRLAAAYLETYANNFLPTDQGASSAGFVQTFRQCHAQALDFLSSSAIRAPYGYGAQITTVMTRIESLGDRIEDMLQRQPMINAEITWSGQIFEMISGIRSLAEQIRTDIPVHDRHLLRLADQRDAIVEI